MQLPPLKFPRAEARDVRFPLRAARAGIGEDSSRVRCSNTNWQYALAAAGCPPAANRRMRRRTHENPRSMRRPLGPAASDARADSMAHASGGASSGAEERRLLAPPDTPAPADATILQEPTMEDQTILDRITALVDEEHRLRDDAAAPEANAARLKSVAEQLDQCWDLLRQRRAKREFGADPETAKPRDIGTVENYTQLSCAGPRSEARFTWRECALLPPGHDLRTSSKAVSTGERRGNPTKEQHVQKNQNQQGGNASQSGNEQQSQSGATRPSKAARTASSRPAAARTAAEPVGRRPRPARQQHQVRSGPGQTRRSKAVTAAAARTSSADPARPSPSSSTTAGLPGRFQWSFRRGAAVRPARLNRRDASRKPGRRPSSPARTCRRLRQLAVGRRTCLPCAG